MDNGRPTDGDDRQLQERATMLVIWSATAALVTAVGVGFAGGFKAAFENNPAIWLPLASLAIPSWLWIRARKGR